MNQRVPLMLALVGALICTTVLYAKIYAYWNDDARLIFSNVPTDARYEPLTQVPSEVSGGPAPDPHPGREESLHAIIQEAAHLYGLDTALLHAIIVVESGYDPRAVSRKGAIGLMQLMPQTAHRYGVVDPYDPSQNIRGGAQHLKYLLRRFDDDVELSVAAYNAGEQAVIERDGNIPPYPETQRYVLKVLEHYARLRAQNIEAPSLGQIVTGPDGDRQLQKVASNERLAVHAVAVRTQQVEIDGHDGLRYGQGSAVLTGIEARAQAGTDHAGIKTVDAEAPLGGAFVGENLHEALQPETGNAISTPVGAPLATDIGGGEDDGGIGGLVQ